MLQSAHGIAGETQCQWRAERKRYPTLAGSKSQPKGIRQVSLRENTDCGTKADCEYLPADS